jgi:4-hydroxy-tetrahydrodipicolinate synthase
VSRLCELCVQADFEAARVVHHQLAEWTAAAFIESNPIPVKAALAMLGLCEAVYRLPMVPPSDASKAKIRQTLVDVGLQPVA